MAYLSESELAVMGFAALGANVRISTKASVYEPEKMRLGDHCRIDDFAVVSGNLTLGRNVYIGPFALVAGGRPGITFADFTTLAYRVTVFAQSDDYSGKTMANPTVPAAYKRELEAPVVLERHAIVGTGSTVMPGVTLGEGTAVGAASLVLRSTDPWTVHAGSPARFVKARLRDLLALEREYLASERG
jgi:acetyltransferase-like isoleucine patch superfamily enzyme